MGKERGGDRKGKGWEVLSLGQMYVEVVYSVPPPLAGNCHVMKLLMFGGIYRPDIPWLPSLTSTRTCFSFVGLHKRNTGNMWRLINFLTLLLSFFCVGFPLPSLLSLSPTPPQWELWFRTPFCRFKVVTVFVVDWHSWGKWMDKPASFCLSKPIKHPCFVLVFLWPSIIA